MWVFRSVNFRFEINARGPSSSDDEIQGQRLVVLVWVEFLKGVFASLLAGQSKVFFDFV